MAEIDISNTISISLLQPSIGAKQVNLSTIALFTDEENTLTEPYKIYRNISGIATDFGTTSNTYKQAVAIFQQSPSILSNSGFVVVIPFLPQVVVPATAGYSISDDINVSNFSACDNGSFKIAIDGGEPVAVTDLNFTGVQRLDQIAGILNNAFQAFATEGYATTSSLTVSNFTNITDGCFSIAVDGGTPITLDGLEFTSATDVQDIAEVIQAKLEVLLPNQVACEEDTGELRFSSATLGANSSIAISVGGEGTDLVALFGSITTSNGRSPLGCTVTTQLNSLVFTSISKGASSSVAITSDTTGVDLSGDLYFGTFATVAGRASYTGRERLVDAVVRTRSMIYYHGVIPCIDMDEEELTNASDYIETQTMMLFVADNSLACCDPNSFFAKVCSKQNHKTRCIAYFGNTLLDARICASAYAGRALSVNFEGAKTTLTMNLKTLTGIEADPNITETLFEKAKTVGADVYASSYGVVGVYSNGANEFFDNVYNDNWLYIALQVAGFNALKQAYTKIPQTAEGIDSLVTAYKEVLDQGVNNGAFAPSTWTQDYPFGNPELFANNIASFGYYIYATPISEQTQESREKREAPVVSIAVKRAGAVHSSSIIVYINN